MNAPQKVPSAWLLSATGALDVVPPAPLGDDEPVQPGRVLPLSRLVALDGPPPQGALLVELGPEDDPAQLGPWIDRLEAVHIRFPRFVDGRGYTQARRLREEIGWRGPLVAVGDVGIDQLHYLLRAGFDRFLLREGLDLDAARRALERFPSFYEGIGIRARESFTGR